MIANDVIAEHTHRLPLLPLLCVEITHKCTHRGYISSLGHTIVENEENQDPFVCVCQTKKEQILQVRQSRILGDVSLTYVSSC